MNNYNFKRKNRLTPDVYIDEEYRSKINRADDGIKKILIDRINDSFILDEESGEIITGELNEKIIQE